MAEKNQCAGPFGAVYDFYISRRWLSGPIGRLVWGVSLAPLYEAIDEIGRVADGSAVLDVPCGGGLSLRALRPEQDVRFVGCDIDAAMLERTREKAAGRGLTQVQVVEADMRKLPFDDASFDFIAAFSGLHMISDPEIAVAELGRVARPGARLVGSSFVSGGSRRADRLFAAGAKRGHAPLVPPEDLAQWFREAGFPDVTLEGEGFTIFRGTRAGEV